MDRELIVTWGTLVTIGADWTLPLKMTTSLDPGVPDGDQLPAVFQLPEATFQVYTVPEGVAQITPGRLINVINKNNIILRFIVFSPL